MTEPAAPLSSGPPTRDGWALAIGRFLIEFSNAEQWVHLMLRTAGTEAGYQAACDPKANASSQLSRLLEGPQFTTANRAMWTRLRDELSDLRPYRNLVAHNDPSLYFFIDKAASRTEMRFTLRSRFDLNKGVTLEELRAATARTEALVHGLQNLSVLIGS